MSETHVGPDGKTYATARCKVCGVECHAMSGEYREAELCPKCYREREEKTKQEQP